MGALVAGLIIFIGMHSIRVVGEGPRTALIGRIGELPYKGAYSIVSLAGLVLIGRGYGQARGGSDILYVPPGGLITLTHMFVAIAFVLAAAAYVPDGYIKRLVRHPMTLAVALWAVGHLLSNGGVADVVLFGGFLVWAVVDYVAALKRNPQPVAAGNASIGPDLIALAIGAIATIAFVLWLHLWLFGVSPVR